MTKETHTRGGYIFALLALPFVYDNYLLNYNFYYKVILLIFTTSLFNKYESPVLIAPSLFTSAEV